MHKRGRVDEIFNIDLQSTDSRFPLTDRDILGDDYGNSGVDNDISDIQYFPPKIVTINRGDIETAAKSESGGSYDGNSYNRTRKRNVENGKESIKNKTINSMPSRVQRVFSVDGQFFSSTSAPDQVDIIVDQILQHDYLMEDNSYSEQLRIETIKSLPQTLTIKRQVKYQLDKSVDTLTQSKTHRVSRWKHLKYTFGIYYKRFKAQLRNAIFNIELWYDSMKTIEGHFGSGVAVYFKFLRWLFILNILLLVMTISFITIPQILFNNLQKEESEVIVINGSLVENFEGSAISHSNGISQANTNGRNVDDEFEFMDLLTAEGYLTNSVLFYGHYTNLTFSPPNPYSLPHAYFMTMICLYIATFVIVSVATARSYRRSFIETYGGTQNLYAHKIFCSWDFGISIEKAANLKHSAIHNELKEVLNDFNKPDVKETKMKNFYKIAAHITAHILILAILAGYGFAIKILLNEIDVRNGLSTWAAMYVSLIINVTMLIIQACFQWILYLENYKSPRTALHIDLLRNFLLEAVVIGVLLGFWLTRVSPNCWETSIGQEIYRLVLIDFFTTTIGASVIQACRLFLSMKWPKVGVSEFDISRGTLGLVFNQTLLWVGLLFSPMLATIVLIKMFLTFYIKKLSLIYLCKAPKRMWRAAQTQTLYLIMIFVSLMGVIITHSYVITQVSVSQNCGPFRGHAYMFEIFVNGILELKNGSRFWKIVMAIAKPAVVGGILLTMGVAVYYLRAKSKSRIAMVKLLKEMLYYESQDREFLLSNINKVTQGKEWMFDSEPPSLGPDRNSFVESSSTWNFQKNNGIGDNSSFKKNSSFANLKSYPSTYSDSNGSPIMRNRRY